MSPDARAPNLLTVALYLDISYAGSTDSVVSYSKRSPGPAGGKTKYEVSQRPGPFIEMQVQVVMRGLQSTKRVGHWLLSPDPKKRSSEVPSCQKLFPRRNAFRQTIIERACGTLSDFCTRSKSGVAHEQSRINGDVSRKLPTAAHPQGL